MTSRQRVLAALRGEAVDRAPVINPTSVATTDLMDLSTSAEVAIRAAARR